MSYEAAPRGVRTSWFVAPVVAVFFGALILLGANRDLWFDEVETVRFFVLVPPVKTLTCYPYTNNHVLFNLVNNLTLRAFGVGTFGEVAAAPWVLRSLAIAYAAVALVYVHSMLRRFVGVRAALIGVVTLATSLPYFNFAAQIRGYSMSAAFLAMLLYHAMAFAETGRRRDAVLVVLSTAFSLHVLPSNLYFVAALAGAHAALAVSARIRPAPDSAARPTWLRPPATRYDGPLAMLIAGGVGVACLLYAPVLGDLVSSPIVAGHQPLRWKTLYRIAPSILDQLVSFQYAAAALAGGGAVLLIRGRAELTAVRHRLVFTSLVVLLLPFGFSFVRGDHPVERSFENATLVVATLAAVTIDVALGWSWFDAGRRAVKLAAVVVVMQATFLVALWAVHERLDREIDEERVSQDLIANYFLGPHYEVDDLTRRFAALPDARTAPVVAADLDWPAVTAYLKRFDVRVLRRGEFEGVAASGRDAYVFTGSPRAFQQYLAAAHPELDASRVFEERNRLTILRVRRRGT